MGEVIEIGISKENVGLYLEFEDPVKGVDEILDYYSILKNKKYSYLTSKGERRFTREGAFETVLKSDQPISKKIRKIYRDLLTDRIGSEEAGKEVRKLK